MISGEPSPFGKWETLFAGGTKPLADIASYPGYAEVLQAYDAVHAMTLEYLNKLPDAKLTERPPAVWDGVRDGPQFQTIGQLFLFIAMHEMSHRGQLADARRALGREPLA